MAVIDQAYIQDKFIEYCKVNTRSDDQSKAVPSPDSPEIAPIAKNNRTRIRKFGLRKYLFF